MDSGEFRFLFSEESRISYRLTIGKSRKAFQTNIYTNERTVFLRIGKRIVPTSSPKSWISRILSGFDSSEERLQSKIHPFLGILKGLGKDIVKFRLLFFPSWKKIVRLVLGYGFAFFLQSIFSVC
ncbi:MAG: hypothetical protein A4E43_00456 [Methanosaeta sp. PtaB.Bin005]|nr:MAG: hypothetical protein A4E43_00456 [Methanosaeta sp. PtaB.Bin005]